MPVKQFFYNHLRKHDYLQFLTLQLSNIYQNEPSTFPILRLLKTRKREREEKKKKKEKRKEKKKKKIIYILDNNYRRLPIYFHDITTLITNHLHLKYLYTYSSGRNSSLSLSLIDRLTKGKGKKIAPHRYNRPIRPVSSVSLSLSLSRVYE